MEWAGKVSGRRNYESESVVTSNVFILDLIEIWRNNDYQVRLNLFCLFSLFYLDEIVHHCFDNFAVNFETSLNFYQLFSISKLTLVNSRLYAAITLIDNISDKYQ